MPSMGRTQSPSLDLDLRAFMLERFDFQLLLDGLKICRRDSLLGFGSLNLLAAGMSTRVKCFQFGEHLRLQLQLLPGRFESTARLLDALGNLQRDFEIRRIHLHQYVVSLDPIALFDVDCFDDAHFSGGDIDVVIGFRESLHFCSVRK